MIFKIDHNSPEPVYSQVAEQTKRAIASGVLKAGQKLPSLRELAKELDISPLTVVKAYKHLEVAGVVETKHGKGTFVANGVVSMDAEKRQQQLAKLCERLVVDGYHLGAQPEEIIETLGRKLTEMLPEFEKRDSIQVEAAP